MRTGFEGYDQWKTASPYDDEISEIDEANRFLKEMEGVDDKDIQWAYEIIRRLLDTLEEEGVI